MSAVILQYQGCKYRRAPFGLAHVLGCRTGACTDPSPGGSTTNAPV